MVISRAAGTACPWQLCLGGLTISGLDHPIADVRFEYYATCGDVVSNVRFGAGSRSLAGSLSGHQQAKHPPSVACAQAPRPVCVNGDFRERSREFAQRFRRRRAVGDPTGSVRPPQGVLGKFRGGWPKSCDEIVSRFWPRRSDNIAARIRKRRGGVRRAGIGVVQIGPAPWPGFMFVDFSAARPARCDGEARGAAKSAVIQVIRLCDNNSREPRGQ